MIEEIIAAARRKAAAITNKAVALGELDRAIMEAEAFVVGLKETQKELANEQVQQGKNQVQRPDVPKVPSKTPKAPTKPAAPPKPPKPAKPPKGKKDAVYDMEELDAVYDMFDVCTYDEETEDELNEEDY